ncbi:polyketide cyclase [Glycomyces fuscus]|nr:polyketide cyclase [Glycomyces fuscus]
MPGSIEHSVVIDAPYDFVWDLTNDVASWPQIFTWHSSVEVLHQEGDTTRFRVTKHPDKQGRVWSWVSERTVDREAGEAWSHRVQTEGFEYVRIHWSYEQVPEGVRLTWRYEFAMKPDAPFDDEQMTVKYKQNVPSEMEHIKERVEAAARARMEEVTT